MNKKLWLSICGLALGAAAVIPSPACAQVPASDGKEKIAYSTNRDGNYEIYVMYADGTGTPLRLTHDEDDSPADDAAPCISPDGNKVLWSSTRNGAEHDLYEANIDGTGTPVRLTSIGDNLGPVYSPDGKHIAFASSRAGGSTHDIWIMDSNGSNPHIVTPRTYDSDHPSFSPDGKQIVFSCNIPVANPLGTSAQRWNIFKVDVNGDELQSLTYKPVTSRVSAENPAWGSSGRIAYTSTTSYGDIDTMDSEGADNVDITNTAGSEDDAAWSPDGRKIVYVSNRDGSDDLYIANADGSGAPLQLTNDDAFEASPSWGPPTNTPIPGLAVAVTEPADGSYWR